MSLAQKDKSVVSLQELMNTGLPLNRKERFYSATVFPMLVCRDGFRYFNRFTSLIEGYIPQPIDARPVSTNIQFFTEYSFAESKIARSIERYLQSPFEKDVPDIMMLIQCEVQGKKHITLIAVEAKMFSQYSPTDLHLQMTKQVALLNGLKNWFLRDDIYTVDTYNIALIPKQWQITPKKSVFQVITWQDLYKQFAKIEIMQDDYFLEILRIALDKFCELVPHHGENNKGYMSGLSIFNESKAETLMMHVMGCNGGLKRAKADVESGKWRLQCYETSPVTDLPNYKWFKIKDFIDKVDALEKT